AAGDDTGADAFRHPGLDDEVADARLDAHELSVAHADALRVRRMEPERIRVGDLVEPLRVRAARVDLHRQAEGRDERHFAGFEILAMDVAADVARRGEVGPAPARERRRVEL